MTRHRFAFTTAYRVAALPFGITPRSAGVEVDGELLRIRFGPWRLRTEVDNLVGVEESGDYAFLKTAGPAHLSLADRGVTFATNPDHGLCIRFAEPARVDFLVGHLHCPAVTVTVEHPAALHAELVG